MSTPEQTPQARLVLVSTDPESTYGYAVTCATCGTPARTDTPPSPGQVVLCPECTLRLMLGPRSA